MVFIKHTLDTFLQDHVIIFTDSAVTVQSSAVKIFKFITNIYTACLDIDRWCVVSYKNCTEEFYGLSWEGKMKWVQHRGTTVIPSLSNSHWPLQTVTQLHCLQTMALKGKLLWTTRLPPNLTLAREDNVSESGWGETVIMRDVRPPGCLSFYLWVCQLISNNRVAVIRRLTNAC